MLNPQNVQLTPNIMPLNTQPMMPVSSNSQSIDTLVHLRIQKRGGRRCLTFIQGLPESVNVKSFTRNLRKTFNCNCTEIDHPKYKKCIQLSGDQREVVKKILLDTKIVRNKKQIKVHGY